MLGLALVTIAVPVAQANVRTLADYPPAIAREAAKSYGPLPAPPIKTLTDYPSAIAREAAKSYGSLPATPSHVESQPGTFDWADATIDAATALALLLVGCAALGGTRRRSHPTGG